MQACHTIDPALILVYATEWVRCRTYPLQHLHATARAQLALYGASMLPRVHSYHCTALAHVHVHVHATAKCYHGTQNPGRVTLYLNTVKWITAALKSKNLSGGTWPRLGPSYHGQRCGSSSSALGKGPMTPSSLVLDSSQETVVVS